MLRLKSDSRRVWRDQECLPADVGLLLQQLTVDPGQLPAYLSLYRGELLGGFDTGDAEDLAVWLTTKSDGLNRHFLRVVVPAALATGGAVGEEALRKALEISPYSEEALRALLLVLGREGSLEAVKREYRAFEKRMLADLGTGPDHETRSIAAQLTHGTAARVSSSIFPPLVPYGPEPDELTVATTGIPRVLIVPPPPPHFAVEPNQQHLANALIDDVTISLCKMRAFAVFAPHTARQIARGTTMFDPQAQAVGYTLSTRLLASRAGGLRLGLSLLRNATGEILIGDDVLLSEHDLAVHHAGLAATIVKKIASSIEKTELATFRRTGSASAYVQYLLGTESLRIVELKDLRRARRAFKRALTLEPEFTPALSMVARTLTLEWLVLGRQERDLLVEARALALRAVEIDPFDASGHRELGHAALYMQDLDECLDHLRSARSRSLHHADTLMDEADAMVHNSSAQLAGSLVDLALSLNPLPPDEYYWTSATVRFLRGEYRSALDTILKMKRIDPAGRFTAAGAAMAGDFELARQQREKIMARQPDFRIKDWSRLMPLKGKEDRERYIEAMRLAGFN